MWGYQPHFRIAVNVALEGAFREIGFQAEAEAFLHQPFNEAGDAI